MRHFSFLAGGLCVLVLVTAGASIRTDDTSFTYTKDVEPVVNKYCLPCHLAENENPSRLALDTFDTLMKGGEHGVPLVAGKPDESILYQKLLDDPPFGKKMPRGRKKMTEEEIKLIYDWIATGAKK